MTRFPILAVALRHERDLVPVRGRTRLITGALGFDAQDQTRIATAISEIARNAYQYAGGGRVEFAVEGNGRCQSLTIRVVDQGPGIQNVESILAGGYESPTGMGIGLRGASRLMDEFRVETAPGQGTTVTLSKYLPHRAPVVTPEIAAHLAGELAAEDADDPYVELQTQNHELVAALAELNRRQEDLERLNRELEETNRGVVALYAELDQNTERLKMADRLKTKFLSYMSHEFRTPLNSIVALTQILLDRLDGDLTAEQEKQVNYIRGAADDLRELVNDLLDLAKVEAGKLEVRPSAFEIDKTLGALRGTMRPLVTNPAVHLIVEEPVGIPPMHSDEAKVTQILRNFLSNAIKYTEHGEIRLRTAYDARRGMVTFAVSDTGIGISSADRQKIFQDYVQVDHARQRAVKGTGLGLSLSKKLAELLGGSIGVESEPGAGSTFWVRLPLVYNELPSDAGAQPARPPRLLLVSQNREEVAAVQALVRDTRYELQVSEASTDLAETVRREQPAVLLIGDMSRSSTWDFLYSLRHADGLRDLPLVALGAAGDRSRALSLGADAFVEMPADRDELLQAIDQAGKRERRAPTVLLVDDEDIARYVLARNLADTGVRLLEARTGEEAILTARDLHPDAIILDLTMPGADGVEVLRALKADPLTASIPVIIHSSRSNVAERLAELASDVAAVVPKSRGDEIRPLISELLARRSMG